MEEAGGGRELVSLLVTYWGPETGFCISFCHKFLCDAKALKSDFSKTIANCMFRVFLEAQPQPQGLFCRKSIAVTEVSETHALKVQSTA